VLTGALSLWRTVATFSAAAPSVLANGTASKGEEGLIDEGCMENGGLRVIIRKSSLLSNAFL